MNRATLCLPLAALLLVAAGPADEGPAGPGTLTVRVLEHDGDPVVGAWVTVPGKARAFTGPSGRARLTDLPAKDVEVRVDREMLPGEPFERVWAGPFPADGRIVEVRFPRRPSIRGRVVGPDGEPVAFLEVLAVDATGQGVATGTTDREGRFRLRVPGDGPFDLHVSGIRYASAPGEAPGVLPLAGHADGVRPGDAPVIGTEKVARDRTLTVRVLSPDGEPIPDASVGAIGWAGRVYGVTGEDGRCVLDGLPDREVTLRVAAFPRDAEAPWVAPAAKDVVPEGQEVELRVRVGKFVRGTVVDGDGKPVSGASVVLPGLDSVRTGADGRFAVAGLPGEPTPLKANDRRDPDARPREATFPRVVPGETDDLKVVLHPAE